MPQAFNNNYSSNMVYPAFIKGKFWADFVDGGFSEQENT